MAINGLVPLDWDSRRQLYLDGGKDLQVDEINLRIFESMKHAKEFRGQSI